MRRSLGREDARAACRRGGWLVCLLLIMCTPVLASVPDWRAFMALRGHTVLSGEDGPALRHPTTVAQDARGRIWIGKTTGVTRLDGDLVSRYTPAEVPAMAAGFIRVFHPLENGDVLLGGDREGVLYWQLESGRFEPVTLPDGSRLSRVNAIEPAVDGGAWVAGEQGLFHWDRQRNQLTAIDLGITQPLDSTRLFDVLQPGDGSVWIAAAPGLYRRGPGERAFAPVALEDARLQQRLRTELSWELASDDQGRLWVGMVQHGVVVIERDGRAHAPAGLDGMDGLHAGTTIRSFVQVGQQMWLGSDGQGLMAVAQGQARRLPVNLGEFLGGRNFHVYKLIAAADGRIWLASSRGVFHLDPDPRGMIELDVNPPGNQAYEQPAMVRSLHLDRYGRLWLGMFGGVLQVLDPYQGTRQRIQLPSPLDASDVVAISSDGDGQIWVLSNGVAVIDPLTLSLRGGAHLPQVPVQRYMAMTSDGQDRIWLGGREGILELDRHGRVLRRMGDERSGLRSNRVLNLAWQPDQLWVGTAEGLHRLDLVRWQATHVPVGTDQGDLPGNRFVSALATDGQQVWAGSLEGLSGGSAQAAALPLLLAQRGQGVVGVAGDGKGGVWTAMRELGIVHRDARQQLRHFGSRDGLHPRTQFHGNGMLTAADGTVLVAVNSGVLMLEPALLEMPPRPLPDLQPAVVSLRLDERNVPASQLPAAGDTLQLSRTVERLTLVFSAMDHVAPGLRQYSYRLEGLDSRWIETGDNQHAAQVFYSRLPVGRYTLLLRTTSSEYPGQEWITRLQLEVPPAWYQLRWVWALAVLGLAGLISAAWHLRLRVARRREQHLQRRVRESTAELRQANARLAQLAGEDALTGLNNRRRGFERLGELHNWRQRNPGQDCLVLMDLDHFKQVNDRHGHLGGDAVLRAVGALLRSQLRAVDIAVRYGGEELLLVLIDADRDEGIATVQRLSAALQALRVEHDGQSISVGASFGLALSEPQQGIEKWIERADAALYRAKNSGRGRLCVEQTDAPVPPVA